MSVLPLLLVAPLLAPVVEVLDVPTIQDRPHRSESYSEVASRISDKDYKYVLVDQHGKPVDEITVAHEGTHMLHASLGKPGWHGFYLGNGFGFRLKIPENARLSDIRVPEHLRTSRYRLYVLDAQRWWDKDVTYLADEALAYLAGAKVRRDLGWEKRSETVRNGRELTEFFRIAIEKVREKDPDYDTGGLEAVLSYLDNSWEEFDD